ncbi:MAG: pyridoxal-dependent decarboxylase [Gemmatimonadetes bacterium]|nr:pyridoxal-dependent decarboxylase [Gemmatimonadota bacterium]
MSGSEARATGSRMAPGEPGPAPDMDAEAFRRYGREVVDRIADVLERPEARRVLPDIEPGDLLHSIPDGPPSHGEPFEAILADYDRLIPQATTHWNHPGFLAYFAISASAPGILAEALAASLNVNAMLWRTGPAQTELEQAMTSWVLRLTGLPDTFDGTINDTASTSTLHALAAAREARADLEVRERGLAGRTDVPPLRVYCSAEAHSSVDKAVATLGMGLSAVRRVPVDDEFRMDVGALENAIAADRAAGALPIAVVATVGTTSTTAVDPVPAIAAVCERENAWLHVDAAYAGSAAAVPEMRWILDGCDRADSIVMNPHKWLFVPIDCSILYTRRPDVLRRAFSVVPIYLSTAQDSRVKNLMDHGVALGRRFRALKLWFVLRYFGADGIAFRLREHMRLARLFASWVDADDAYERLAPVPFSVVNFRYRGPGTASEQQLDAVNAALLDRVNASGEVFLSHTRVRDRFALHLAVGNLHTREQHIARAWQLIREAAPG